MWLVYPEIGRLPLIDGVVVGTPFRFECHMFIDGPQARPVSFLGLVEEKKKASIQ